MNNLTPIEPNKSDCLHFFKKKDSISKSIEIIQKTAIDPCQNHVFVSDHFLEELFPNLSSEQQKIVADRLEKYARACHITSEKMYLKIQAGKKVAEKIDSGERDKINSTDDLVNFDWFLHAQMAKMNGLYLHGTVKFPDPEFKFLEFALHTKGTFHGKSERIYSRLTSHWPELRKKIYEPKTLPNGEFIAFNKKEAKSYKKLHPHSKVRIYESPNFGIDASNCKKKSLNLAGKNKKTFLIMNFEENTLDNQKVSLIAIKNEGHSASKEISYHHFKESICHTIEWIRKKGPIKFLRKQPTPHPNFIERKEDVLSKVISDNLKHIHLKQKGAENTYKELQLTSQKGSEYSLMSLKTHLEALIPYKKDKKELKAIHTILDEIDSIYKSYEEISKDWEYRFHPRSNECILPTIGEMLDDKVPFIN